MSDDDSTQPLLAELARRYGVQREYTDAAGERREVSVETLQAVLQILRVNANSDDAVRSAIEQDDRHAWTRALPPVVVIREGRDELAVEITVPEELSDCRWYLDLEEGRAVEGQVALSELPLVDRREVDGVPMQRRRLLVPGALPRGYHLLRIDGAASTCRLIICPAQCWLPTPGVNEPRLWGVTTQLYLLRSARNWGMGDFTDLKELMGTAPERDIDVVGINPLHALFPDQPERASPYSPSSRVLLNVLYLDVTAIEGFGELPTVRALVEQADFREKLAACQASDLVCYEQVAALKGPVLRLLFSSAAEDRSSSGWREFESFRAEQGEPLRLGCLFQALREHFSRLDQSRADWWQWPHEFQNPGSTSVVAFAESHTEEVTFLQWLQWQADRQLAQASAAGGRMRVGLYRDLAVGTDPAGAECWANQGLILSGVHIGSPPDLLQANGQDWGLAPFDPRKLKEERYEHFTALLRANMRYAGALRIDHAMSLERLYWVPGGASARDGAYVGYPLHDLLGIVALESERHECVVIGEDLGTVTPEFREHMREAGMLSYRVLSFERAADGSFLPAAAYPELALAVAGNHDLPTLRGWWEGRDIHDEKKREERALDRRRLLDVLGLRHRDVERVSLDEVIAAVHSFLRHTPCLLAMAQLDDLERQPEPVNVPGTSDEYPNWRRRLGSGSATRLAVR